MTPCSFRGWQGEGKEKTEVQYMFLKYADGTAKLKASLAATQLYRYRTPGAGEPHENHTIPPDGLLSQQNSKPQG